LYASGRAGRSARGDALSTPDIGRELDRREARRRARKDGIVEATDNKSPAFTVGLPFGISFKIPPLKELSGHAGVISF
jgi:hypothetical protein